MQGDRGCPVPERAGRLRGEGEHGATPFRSAPPLQLWEEKGRMGRGGAGRGKPGTFLVPGSGGGLNDPVKVGE